MSVLTPYVFLTRGVLLARQVHPGDINMIAYGLATPLNSSLREELSLALLQLQENGFLQSLYRCEFAKWGF